MAGSHDDAIASCTGALFPRHLEPRDVPLDCRSDDVMVLGEDLTILYATELTWDGHAPINRNRRLDTCYKVFADRSEPCPICPVTRFFQSRHTIPSSFSTHDVGATQCGIQQIIALKAADGLTDCALAFLKTDRVGAMIGSSATEEPRPEEQSSAAHHLEKLIGQSAVMQHLFTMIHRVAESQATVLLEGETGTGKELVAKTIHRLSDRRHRPFIVVDCGSLTETLLESELFGHVKGAFTGAVSSKKGLFEEADGGTLFLDEIADTTPHFQAKLLRVIQEGEIKPVGSARSVQVDVRIISATNRDLLGLIKRRTFREDLYYRLAVLPLVIPALRDRRDDIPLLAQHFVETSCRRHGRPRRTITARAMHALTHASWLGNVRQLQHAIERAVLTGSGFVLTEEDVMGKPPEAVRQADLANATRHAVQTVERAGIQEALRHADGNKARAARLLNISRASLYTKLRMYGISHSS